MTKQEWIHQAIEHREKLASLIGEWHPVVRTRVTHDSVKITAKNAEAACERIRNNIRQNFEGDPIQQFYEALDQDDVSKVMKLLNDTWFGVPESTSCWRIEGFREAVDLMDDPPE